MSVETAGALRQLSYMFRASMGPRSDERGNLTHSCPFWSAGPTLQWGHARMSVETRDSSTPLTLKRMASMGPRSDERGNRDDGPDVAHRVQAASMGPRSDERGNHSSGRGHWRTTEGFNGATLG